jgi:hypothetical protein
MDFSLNLLEESYHSPCTHLATFEGTVTVVSNWQLDVNLERKIDTTNPYTMV